MLTTSDCHSAVSPANVDPVGLTAVALEELEGLPVDPEAGVDGDLFVGDVVDAFGELLVFVVVSEFVVLVGRLACL